MPEAQAIALEMENIISNRPMTHDLFKSFAHEFKFDVEEIVISDLKDGVFFARIVCTGPDGRVEIDARPSDAIAIGLRFKAPIFAIDKIMDEAGIVLTAPRKSRHALRAPRAARSRWKTTRWRYLKTCSKRLSKKKITNWPPASGMRLASVIDYIA